MNQKDNPNNPASNDPQHDPSQGATVTEQESNAAREDRGKGPLPSENVAKEQAPPAPVAETKPPTTSPAAGQQTSANLVQTTSEFSGFSEPAADGKSTATLTIHIVRQPADARSEQAIVFAALSDEHAKAQHAL